MNDEA